MLYINAVKAGGWVEVPETPELLDFLSLASSELGLLDQQTLMVNLRQSYLHASPPVTAIGKSRIDAAFHATFSVLMDRGEEALIALTDQKASLERLDLDFDPQPIEDVLKYAQALLAQGLVFRSARHHEAIERELRNVAFILDEHAEVLTDCLDSLIQEARSQAAQTSDNDEKSRWDGLAEELYVIAYVLSHSICQGRLELDQITRHHSVELHGLQKECGELDKMLKMTTDAVTKTRDSLYQMDSLTPHGLAVRERLEGKHFQIEMGHTAFLSQQMQHLEYRKAEIEAASNETEEKSDTKKQVIGLAILALLGVNAAIGIALAGRVAVEESRKAEEAAKLLLDQAPPDIVREARFIGVVLSDKLETIRLMSDQNFNALTKKFPETRAILNSYRQSSGPITLENIFQAQTDHIRGSMARWPSPTNSPLPDATPTPVSAAPSSSPNAVASWERDLQTALRQSRQAQPFIMQQPSGARPSEATMKTAIEKGDATFFDKVHSNREECLKLLNFAVARCARFDEGFIDLLATASLPIDQPSTNNDQTPLYTVVSRALPDLAQVLIDRLHADPTVVTSHGTVLHALVASWYSEPSVNKFIQQMKAMGVPLDARDSTGDTAFHKAIKTGNLLLATALRDAGANISLPDGQGHTPRQLALQYYVETDDETQRALLFDAIDTTDFTWKEFFQFSNKDSQGEYLSTFENDLDKGHIKDIKELARLIISTENSEYVRAFFNYPPTREMFQGWTPEQFHQFLDNPVQEELVHQSLTYPNPPKRPSSNYDSIHYASKAAHPTDYSRDLTQLKFLSHAWELEGTPTIGEYSFTLEGAFARAHIDHFRTALDTFPMRHPHMLDSQQMGLLTDLLTYEVTSHSSYRPLEELSQQAPIILSAIHRDFPALILSGWTGHVVDFVFYKGYLMYCNRGGGRTGL